jgi:hypothetical protein
MSEPKTYTGGCHCGKVRYEVTTDMSSAVACNCSICMKRGLILTFAPEENFKLLSGQDDLTDYQFGKKMIHHIFCPSCGVESFARGTAPNGMKMAAINIRCLDGVDISSLKPTPFNGRDL